MEVTQVVSGKDLKWLKEAHLKSHYPLPPFGSALIYGDVNYPSKVELYTDRQPQEGARPILVLRREFV